MEGQRSGHTGSQVSKAGGRYLQKSDVTQVALLPVVKENKVKVLDPEKCRPSWGSGHLTHLPACTPAEDDIRDQ